ncbi:MAG: HDIG domain-containing metalloprotein [Pseudomonadota bacterium]
MIPSVEECLEFIKRYEMLPNIRAHSLMVERVAGLITQALRDNGLTLCSDKVAAGALLHDIGKTICLQSGGDHAALGKEICLENQLNEIADIVAEHVRLKDFDPEGPFQEKEIVYYADKRVNHDAVVGLADRREYILERYGRNEEKIRTRIMANFALSEEVEKKIFAGLEFPPDDLACRIDKTGPSL